MVLFWRACGTFCGACGLHLPETTSVRTHLVLFGYCRRLFDCPRRPAGRSTPWGVTPALRAESRPLSFCCGHAGRASRRRARRFCGRRRAVSSGCARPPPCSRQRLRVSCTGGLQSSVAARPAGLAPAAGACSAEGRSGAACRPVVCSGHSADALSARTVRRPAMTQRERSQHGAQAAAVWQRPSRAAVPPPSTPWRLLPSRLSLPALLIKQTYAASAFQVHGIVCEGCDTHVEI